MRVRAAAIRLLSCGSATLLLACGNEPGGTGPAVASVTVSPPAAMVAVGQAVPLAATPRSADGKPLTGRSVSWASSAPSVAPVDAAGVVTGVAVGTATVTATSEQKSATAAITVTAGVTGTPDPTLLPLATTAQASLTAAYDALQVPALAAGGWYLDPTTGVRIHKLTSGTFPAPSANWGHDYSEGGDEVSLPYSGNTRAVLVRQDGGSWWLVDFTPGGGVGNGRQLMGNLAPIHDQAFAFSSNPTTPYYAYVSDGGAVRRFDIRTMTEAPGSGWPVTGETDAVWLQQSENDGLFTWLRGQSGPTVAAYEPATGTLKTYTDSGVNEPRIDRAGRYIGLSMNTPPEALFVWDFTTNTIAWTTSGDPGIPFSHNASLRRRWLVVDWNSSAPHQYAMFIPDVANSGQYIGGPANANDFYGNGNWIQHPPDLNDQWAVFSTMEGLQSSGGGWLAPGGMVLITPNGQRRLLGHPYNTSASYAFYSFVRFSPDGRYVLFTSDMDGAGRCDVFLAEVPTR